jgi:hypothetical protein
MPRIGIGAQSRRACFGRRAIPIACVLTILALPAPSLADPPARDQYVPPPLSSTGHGSGSSHGGSAVQASGESNSYAIPILLAGLGAIAAAVLAVYLRRRRALPTAARLKVPGRESD